MFGDLTTRLQAIDSKAAIPYAFDIDRWLVMEDKELGLDYAAVALDTIYQMQLEAGGCKP
jgi:hypothetical protein